MTSQSADEEITARMLDGKSASLEIEAVLTTLVSKLPTPPCLALINIGTEYSSELYVKRKIEACARVGIRATSHSQAVSSTEEILELVQKLNTSPDVSGILVQLPLPRSVDSEKILTAISPSKDVDGFHPENLGRTLCGNAYLSSATPVGIMKLLNRNAIQLKGKQAVVIGRSVIVGRPMAALLTNADATVTLCHSQTKNIKSITRQAEIIVVAVGSPWFVGPDMIRPGAVVVDVGINRTEQGKLVGDVHPDVAQIAGWLTPVPGGVGPMTIGALLTNTLIAHLMSSPSALQRLRKESPELLGSLYPDLL